MSATQALATYVVESDVDAIPRDVRSEAKRAILNYLGCALGGSIEPALDIAIETLAPFSGERSAVVHRPAREVRSAACRAAERHQLARARVRRHPAEELHSSERPGRLGVVRVREREPRDRRRLRARVHPRLRSRVAHRQCRVSGALRRRLAHHVHDGRVRRGGGDRQAARALGAADGLGIRPRRDAGRRASARCSGRWRSRFSQAAPRRTVTRPRSSAAPTSRPASARSKDRAASRR